MGFSISNFVLVSSQGTNPASAFTGTDVNASGEIVGFGGDLLSDNFDGEVRRRGAQGGAGAALDESVYSVRIHLLKDRIMADGKEVALTPGMGVTAEIKVGPRRVIEYILGPVMQYRDESLRER